MLKKIVRYALVIILVGAHPICAEDADLGQLFKDSGSDGTIVISSLKGDVRHVWNKKRSRIRYTPASTFKIPNTLIALEEGMKEEQLFKWDGTKHFRKEWNKDQTLKSAFSVSCVWAYQKIAEDIGDESYLSHLSKLNYGNAQTGDELTTFWLKGDLKISAEEQVEFLKGIYSQTFPYLEDSYRILKKIMVVEQAKDYTLRAKTGWTLRKKEKVRWYVGYVVSSDDVWFFAANIDMPKWRNRLVEDEIVMRALRLKGMIGK